MSTSGVRRTLFPDAEDEPPTPRDFASFASTVEERMAAASRFRDLRAMIQTSPAVAYRVGGFGTPRKQAAAPIPELFRELLRLDFGISATPDQCAGASGFLRQLVAESFRRIIPLVDDETLSKRSALNLTIAYRALYTRLYDTVRRPFDARQLDTAATRGFWRGYSHGGMAVVEIETRQRRILALVSILSIYRALASRGTFEQLMNGNYGGFLTLVDGELVVDGDDDQLDIDTSMAPIYLANWLPDGRADTTRRAIYFAHDDGVLAVDLNKVLREFAGQTGFWPTEDSFALASVARGSQQDSLLIGVVADGMPVERRFFEIDRAGTATPFEPATPLAGSFELLLARPDVSFASIVDSDSKWVLVVQYGARSARRTDRIDLARHLAERGYVPEDAEWQISIYGSSFANRSSDNRLRLFAMLTITWHLADEPAADFITSVLVRVDCRANGSISSAVAFLLPPAFTETTLPPNSVFNGSTVIMRRKAGDSERLLTFDTVSGEAVVLPAFVRYDWLVDAERQSTTLLSILNDEFDNSAGVASARDYTERQRYEASVLEVQRDSRT